MIQIKDKSQCCGCTACAAICAHQAIEMVPDALGFLYPKIDETKCVECGLCEKVCAFNNEYDKSENLSEPLAYGARHKDEQELMKSRSGAVFAALSDYVLEHGGVVYGAGYKDHFRVTHKRATTKEERDEFRGSKYVQSDLTGVFCRVKEDLRKGLYVMFVGTPCQTAGLNAYIGKKSRKNLLLADVICHGVPAPSIWLDYVQYVEKESHKAIDWVSFRDKEHNGWAAHNEAFAFAGEKQIEKRTWYTEYFYKGIMFRKSCTVCPFTNLQRPSDVTLGDFWGWEKWDSKSNADDKGVSLVLCNTENGKVLFDKISSSLNYKEATPDQYMQTRLQFPAKEHPKRDQFEKDYARHGFEYIYAHNYDKRTLWERILNRYVKLLK